MRFKTGNVAEMVSILLRSSEFEMKRFFLVASKLKNFNVSERKSTNLIRGREVNITKENVEAENSTVGGMARTKAMKWKAPST